MTYAKRAFLAVLSGGLLILSFPWARLGWLAFVALVPLLAVIYEARPRQSFFYGWLTGLVFFAGLCYWVALYGVWPWLLMAVAIGFFFAVTSAAAGWLAARLSRTSILLVLPTLWVGLEILRSETGVYSFPFGVLGYSQAGFRPALGLASIIGVYGLSWVIVLVNVAIIELIRTRLTHCRDNGAIAIAALGLVVLALGLGAWAAARVQPASGPAFKVALVQASVRQDQKWLATKQDEIMAEYESLVLRAGRRHPDLIVLPEAALPAYVEKDSSLYNRLAGWAKRTKTPILAGVPLLSQDKAMNTAVLFDAAGEPSVSYGKMIPTLFGEQVPWRPVTELMYPMFRSIGDITPGSHQTVFHLAAGRRSLAFGVLICSESFYQSLARRAASQHIEALFVLTNDAWFYTTSEARLHFDMTALRAAETGLYVTQTANTGISGLFDPAGHPVATLGINKIGVVAAALRARDDRTLYVRGGWLFPYVLLGLSALLAGLNLAGERLHKATKG